VLFKAIVLLFFSSSFYLCSSTKWGYAPEEDDHDKAIAGIIDTAGYTEKKSSRIGLQTLQEIVERNDADFDEIITLLIEYRENAEDLLDYIFDQRVDINTRIDIVKYLLNDFAFKKYSMKIGDASLVLLEERIIRGQTKAEIAEAILSKAHMVEYHERVARNGVDFIKNASVNSETKALLTLEIFLSRNLGNYHPIAERKTLDSWEKLLIEGDLSEKLDVDDWQGAPESRELFELRKSVFSLTKEVIADNILKNPLLETYHEKALGHASEKQVKAYKAKKRDLAYKQALGKAALKRKKEEQNGIKRVRRVPRKLDC
jgi:hypothetical protein